VLPITASILTNCHFKTLALLMCTVMRFETLTEIRQPVGGSRYPVSNTR
jgi:hypothetical protein